MKLYSKSFQMKKKNICIILTLVMSLLYFALGVIYADDISMRNAMVQSHSISSILQVERHNDSFVENSSKTLEYCEKQNSVSFSEMRIRRVNYKVSICRLFVMLSALIFTVSFFYVAFLENVRCISYHIIRFLHRSDGKKRMSY